MGKNNKSGYTGVCKSTIWKRNKYVTYWVATWASDGKVKYKRFNIETYGEEEAKRLAIECREKNFQKLLEDNIGYTENHGK